MLDIAFIKEHARTCRAGAEVYSGASAAGGQRLPVRRFKSHREIPVDQQCEVLSEIG